MSRCREIFTRGGVKTRAANEPQSCAMITSAVTPGIASGPDPAAERAGTAPRGARFVGLAIACLFPAVLWGELIAAITTWVGAPLASPHHCDCGRCNRRVSLYYLRSTPSVENAFALCDRTWPLRPIMVCGRCRTASAPITSGEVHSHLQTSASSPKLNPAAGADFDC
jgi:hypothetical protein